MTSHVEITERDGVLIIRMNRPEKKNALTAEMYDAMSSALKDAPARPEIGAVLITGTPGAFSAGNDISAFAEAAETGRLGDPVLNFLKALARCELPLIAAVDGLAIGIGTTMLFHADLVFASERSSFRTPFADLGLVPEAGSSLLGPRIMGHIRAFELLVAGVTFDAQRAYESGFVSHVVSSDAVETAAFVASAALAAKPRGAILASRRLLKGDPAEILRRIDEEAAAFSERLRSPEAQAAVQAFLARSAAKAAR